MDKEITVDDWKLNNYTIPDNVPLRIGYGEEEVCLMPGDSFTFLDRNTIVGNISFSGNLICTLNPINERNIVTVKGLGTEVKQEPYKHNQKEYKKNQAIK